LTPAARGAAFGDVVAGQVDKAKTFYGGVAAGAGAVSDAALAPVRAVGEFAQGALGVPPPVAPGLR
jgi:ribosomal protein S12 methylthiotransferase accessory factor YcaO